MLTHSPRHPEPKSGFNSRTARPPKANTGKAVQALEPSVLQAPPLLLPVRVQDGGKPAPLRTHCARSPSSGLCVLDVTRCSWMPLVSAVHLCAIHTGSYYGPPSLLLARFKCPFNNNTWSRSNVSHQVHMCVYEHADLFFVQGSWTNTMCANMQGLDV